MTTDVYVQQLVSWLAKIIRHEKQWRIVNYKPAPGSNVQLCNQTVRRCLEADQRSTLRMSDPRARSEYRMIQSGSPCIHRQMHTSLRLLHHVVKEPFFQKSYEWRYDKYFYFLHYNVFQPWCTHCTLYKGEVGFLSSCWVLQNLFFSSPIKRSLSLVHTLSHCT